MFKKGILSIICVFMPLQISAKASELYDLENLLATEITTASKKSERAFDASAAVYILSQYDIQQLGMTTLPEILRFVPGIQVAQADSATWAVSSRGFNDVFSNKLLVLIDGRTIYNPFSAIYWDIHDVVIEDIEDIERIEVIRGSGATLWGSNAVNGIINIVTKSAKDTLWNFTKIRAGNHERFGTVGRTGQKIDDIYYRAYLKYDNRNETKTLSGRDAGDTWDTARGGFRADWERENYQYTVQGEAYTGTRNFDISVATLTPPFSEPRDDSLEVIGGNILAHLHKLNEDGSEFTFRTFIDNESAYYSVLDRSIYRFDIDFQHNLNLYSNNELTWGAGYRLVHDNLEGTQQLSFHEERRTTHLYSAFIQDKIFLLDNTLVFTIGSKFEHNDFTGFEVQPNARIAWHPTEQQTFWSAISRSTRTPDRAEDDISLVVANLQPGFVRWTGSRSMESETVTSYELGYKYKPTESLLFDISAFFNDYKHLRTFEESTPFIDGSGAVNVPLVVSNNASAHTYGVEVASHWNITDYWDLRTAYSFLQMDVDAHPTSTDAFATTIEHNSPQHMFNIHSHLTLPYNISVNHIMYYTDSLPGLALPSHLRFDMNIIWKPTNDLKLSLVGQNLFDHRHAEWAGPLDGEQVEIRRSIYGQITFNF